MLRCRSFLLPLSAGALLAFISPAQTAPTSQNAAPAAQTPAPPVLRTGANLVLVDVIVTEKGKPVDDLAQSQFHIQENGKEQKISFFETHRAADAPQIAHLPTLPPGVYSNAPRYAVASAANVLLLDALNTPLADQQYVRSEMKSYVRHIPPGTRIAVFTLASRLRMVEGFTTDAGTIEAAVTLGKGRPQQSGVLESPQDQDTENDMAANMSSIDNGLMQQFLADTASFQTDLRVRITLDALAQLGRYLNTVPGRKNLIWFSGSFPLAIDPDPTQSPTLTSNAPASPLDPFSPMRDYAEQIRQTDSLLAAARVAVYPVDARGLMDLASTDASRDFSSPTGVPGGPSERIRPSAAQHTDSAFVRQTVTEHQAMQQIAEETGGEAFYEDNGLKEAVAKAIANGSDYFTIGYVPQVHGWDGAFRSLQVGVDGGKYDLAYRRGYYAVDPSKPSAETPGIVSPIVASLQHGAPPISQLIFEARVLAANDPAAKDVKPVPGPVGEMAQSLKSAAHRYLADFSVDPHAITWSAAPNGGAHAEIEVSMVAWDADGHRVNYTDHAFAVNLDLAQSGKVLSSGLPLHQEIDLPSGAIGLRLAVHDLRNGRIGSMEIPLTVPKS
jgi:VWFA-related protein